VSQVGVCVLCPTVQARPSTTLPAGSCRGKGKLPDVALYTTFTVHMCSRQGRC
jgi:hypothetical protein